MKQFLLRSAQDIHGTRQAVCETPAELLAEVQAWAATLRNIGYDRLTVEWVGRDGKLMVCQQDTRAVSGDAVAECFAL